MRRLSGLVLNVLVALPAAAAPPPTSPSTRLRVDVRVLGFYDSNPVEYSSSDQTAFLTNSPASRFAIRSIDDGVFRGSASVSLSRRLSGARFSRIRYSYSRSAYDRDPIQDYATHSLALRQPIPGALTADLSWSHLPSYYVRQLWDDDLVAPFRFYPHYQAATFSSDRVKLEVTRDFRGPWSAGASVERSLYDYNATFDERDTKGWEFAATGGWARPRIGSIELTTSFERRSADATDPSHPAIPDSLRDDISTDAYALGLDVSLPEGRRRALPVSVDVRLDLVRRVFTTDRVADVFHHGRRDFDVDLDVEAERRLGSGVAPFVFWRLQTRSSSGIASSATARGDAIDFLEHQVGGGLHFWWSRGAS